MDLQSPYPQLSSFGCPKADQNGASGSREGCGARARESRKECGFLARGLAIESEYDRTYMGRIVVHVMVDFIKGATSLSGSSPMLLEHGVVVTPPRRVI